MASLTSTWLPKHDIHANTDMVWGVATDGFVHADATTDSAEARLRKYVYEAGVIYAKMD